MRIELIDNTHARIVDQPGVDLYFKEEAADNIQSIVLGI